VLQDQLRGFSQDEVARLTGLLSRFIANGTGAGDADGCGAADGPCGGGDPED
jgi:hypothetical protein